MDQLDVIVVAEHRDHFIGLVHAQEAVIDKDTGQLIADRLVQQYGRHRRIHPTRKAADHLFVADLFADAGNRLFAIGAHGPVPPETGQTDEVLVKRLAIGGVVDLGVELHGKEIAVEIGGNGVWRVGGCAVDFKTGGQFRDVIAMAHPDLFGAIEEPAEEQRIAAGFRFDIGAAEFGGAAAARDLATLDLAAQLFHHHLLAITDAKDRQAHPEQLLRRARGAFAGDTVGAARQDHGARSHLAEEPGRYILVGVDFAIDIQFAQAPGDELCHLAAEVDDQQAVVRGLWGLVGGGGLDCHGHRIFRAFVMGKRK